MEAPGFVVARVARGGGSAGLRCCTCGEGVGKRRALLLHVWRGGLEALKKLRNVCFWWGTEQADRFARRWRRLGSVAGEVLYAHALR